MQKLLFDKLIAQFPMLKECRSLKPSAIKIYKNAGLVGDQFGIPCPNPKDPEYLARRHFFASLPAAAGNAILTGDPYFALDPTFYKYC